MNVPLLPWLILDSWLLIAEYWLLIVEDWLLVIDCWILMIEYWLLVVESWLLIIGFWWLSIDYRRLIIGYCPAIIDYWWLVSEYWLLIIDDWLLLIGCWLLVVWGLIVDYWLFIIKYCLLIVDDLVLINSQVSSIFCKRPTILTRLLLLQFYSSYPCIGINRCIFSLEALLGNYAFPSESLSFRCNRFAFWSWRSCLQLPRSIPNISFSVCMLHDNLMKSC